MDIDFLDTSLVLRDIIKSKRAANRKKDRAVLPILEETLREKEKA